MELKTQNQETINENIKVDDLIVLDSKNICKSYKNVQVLNNISIKIEKGNVYGLVGENGSGKTTFMRLITGLQNPTSGEYSLFNVNFNDKKIIQSRKKVAGIIEAPSFFPNFTAFDNLKFQATLLNVKTTNEELKSILTSVGLSDSTLDKKKVKNFSLGMKQRLAIAMCLIGKPEFLILDEPINGLDPEGVAEIRKLINHLSQDKKITILISSHILSELSKVATKYGFIHKGKLVQEISAEELENRVSKKTLIIVNDVAEATKLLDDKKIKYSMSSKPNEIILDGGKTIKEVNEIFNGTNIEVTDIKVNQEDLESYYINLVNSSSKGV